MIDLFLGDDTLLCQEQVLILLKVGGLYLLPGKRWRRSRWWKMSISDRSLGFGFRMPWEKDLLQPVMEGTVQVRNTAPKGDVGYSFCFGVRGGP